jgi:hypothetical protein
MPPHCPGGSIARSRGDDGPAARRSVAVSAVASAATATLAAIASTAAESTATRTLLTRLGLVDGQCPAVVLLPIESSNGGLSFLI